VSARRVRGRDLLAGWRSGSAGHTGNGGGQCSCAGLGLPRYHVTSRGDLDRIALVNMRAAGRASVYSLAQPALLDLFTAAEEVLAATGNAVAVCPAYGQPR
jgi:hypothetical protein